MAPIHLFRDLHNQAKELLGADYVLGSTLLQVNAAAGTLSYSADCLLENKSSPHGSKNVYSNLKLSSLPNEVGLGIVLDRLSMDSTGCFTVEASLYNAMKGVNLKMRASDRVSNPRVIRRYSPTYATVGVEFQDEDKALSMELDVANGPKLTTSAMYSIENYFLGGEIKLDSSVNEKPNVEDTKVALGYKKEDHTITFSTEHDFHILKGSHFQKVASDLLVGTMMEYDRVKEDATMTVGFRKVISDGKGSARPVIGDDEAQVLSSKINSKGLMAVSFSQTISKNQLQIQLSAELNLKSLESDTHKFGVGIKLGM